MNPFNLAGPQFLVFFGILAAVVFAAAIWLRWWLRTPGDAAGAEADGMSPYDLAYLNEGVHGAINAAISRLVHRDVLTASATQRKLSRSTRPLSKKATVLEQAIHDAVDESGIEVLKVRKQVRSSAESHAHHLQELGLVVDNDQAIFALVLPLVLFLCVIAIGFIKILVGLARGRPVEFLIVACILLLVAGLWVFGRKVHRSRRGDQVLARLKQQNAALRTTVSSNSAQLTGSDIVMAVGLYGVGVLANGPLSQLVHTLQPPPQSNTSGGCGTSSYGGGGGCGGGCGGGGCGGCGS